MTSTAVLIVIRLLTTIAVLTTIIIIAILTITNIASIVTNITMLAMLAVFIIITATINRIIRKPCKTMLVQTLNRKRPDWVASPKP